MGRGGEDVSICTTGDGINIFCLFKVGNMEGGGESIGVRKDEGFIGYQSGNGNGSGGNYE